MFNSAVLSHWPYDMLHGVYADAVVHASVMLNCKLFRNYDVHVECASSHDAKTCNAEFVDRL